MHDLKTEMTSDLVKTIVPGRKTGDDYFIGINPRNLVERKN
jgi:hypothetical protein